MNILKTQRLTLRTTKQEDIDSLHQQIFSDKIVVKHTFGQDGFNLLQTKDFILKRCNFDAKLGLSTLIENETQQIIGLAGILPCNYLNQMDYEFGFILGSNFWGKGYATEIGQAQIEFVQHELSAQRVIALVHQHNTASINTIKKLGLNYYTQVSTDSRGDRAVYIKEFIL